jgi:hypothetical protein
MEDCANLQNCPIFNRFKLEGLKNFWIRIYCKGARQEECERKKLKSEGKEVPINLLPNGEQIKSIN